MTKMMIVLVMTQVDHLAKILVRLEKILPRSQPESCLNLQNTASSRRKTMILVLSKIFTRPCVFKIFDISTIHDAARSLQVLLDLSKVFTLGMFGNDILWQVHQVWHTFLDFRTLMSGRHWNFLVVTWKMNLGAQTNSYKWVQKSIKSAHFDNDCNQ